MSVENGPMAALWSGFPVVNRKKSEAREAREAAAVSCSVPTTKTSPLHIPVCKGSKFNAASKSTRTMASSIPTTSSSFDGHISLQRHLQIASPPPIFSVEVEVELEHGVSEAPQDASNAPHSPHAPHGKNADSLTAAAMAAQFSDFNHNEKDEPGSESGSESESDFEDEDFDSSDIDSDTSNDPPILWNFADYFFSLPGNDWCVRIPRIFIQDEFNLFELSDVFHCSLRFTDCKAEDSTRRYTNDFIFDDLLDFITIEDLTEDPIGKISDDLVQDSLLLYKLLHQRYIMTKAGMQEMWRKFDHRAFGVCPRYLCQEQALLPVALSALPGREFARAYCLNCQDLYVPATQRHAKMDGVPFGPSFAHFFIRSVLYAHEEKAQENRAGSHAWQLYVPKIYGFKLHRSQERIKEILTLRSRPYDYQ